MKIRNKLVIGFTAIVLFSGAMGFTAVDGILRTSRLTTELFEYPLMASSFARSAQAAFVRIRLAGENTPVIVAHERAVREDLSTVSERLRDPAGAALITHMASTPEYADIPGWRNSFVKINKSLTAYRKQYSRGLTRLNQSGPR